MGVKDGFMGASVLVKVSFVLLLISTLFSWIAFTTTSWGYLDLVSAATDDKRGYGLWRVCDRTVGGPCGMVDGTRRDWYATFQAFGIFGFIGTNVAMLLLILYMFGGPCKGNGEAKMATFIVCFVAAVCWLICVIIFGAEWDDYTNGSSIAELGFSFALAIVSLIITIVVGILLIVDGKGGGGTSPA